MYVFDIFISKYYALFHCFCGWQSILMDMKLQYPFQPGRALFPPPAVSLEQPGGCALLRATAEPEDNRKSSR